MEKDAVEAAGPDGRGRSAVASAAADAGGPLAARGDILQNREFDARHGRPCHLRRAGKKFGDVLQTLAASRADQNHRRAQLRRQRHDVDFPAAAAEIVGHVEDHQGGQSQAQHRGGEHQVTGEIGGIQHQQHRVRTRQAGHLAQQHVMGDAFVFGARIEAIDAGKVDGVDLAVTANADLSQVMLDGDAGEIRHFLAESGEPVKERGFARVGRADEGDNVAGCIRTGGRRRCEAGSSGGGVTIGHTLILRTAKYDWRLTGAQIEAPRGIPAQGDFRTVHAKHLWISAGRRMRDSDLMAGHEAHFHQAASIIGRKLQSIQNPGLSTA